MSLDGLDAWKTDAPEPDEERVRCCVCGGEDDDQEPACSEECQHLVDALKTKSSIAHLYEFCRRAMGLARQYRSEERVRGRKSRRMAAVLEQVACWRQDIKYIRAARKQKEAA